MAAAVGWLVLSVPLFLMITNGGTFVWVLFGQLLFQIPVACLQGTGTAAVSEVFATGKRGTWVSISTAVGNAVFGGFAPYIATLLVSSTGIAISPAFYVMAIALLALAAGILMPERASLALHD
jgi:MHS family proline/betaine transporter-like MFS transporter